MELDALERLIGLKLPKAYRQLYRWHNGEKDRWDADRWGHIYGLPLLPLREVATQWKAWLGVPDSFFHGDRYGVAGSAWPPGTIDPAYINLRRLPLTNDGSGNHIGIDFDPWPQGRVGQIILYGRDEGVKVVLADSLGEFMGWLTRLLEAAISGSARGLASVSYGSSG